jgi:hypothetical protein
LLAVASGPNGTRKAASFRTEIFIFELNDKKMNLNKRHPKQKHTKQNVGTEQTRVVVKL